MVLSVAPSVFITSENNATTFRFKITLEYFATYATTFSYIKNIKSKDHIFIVFDVFIKKYQNKGKCYNIIL